VDHRQHVDVLTALVATAVAVGLADLLANEHVYLVVDPGSNPTIPDSSNGDTVAFRLTVLRPGQ
jgi:hypothetical protein